MLYISNESARRTHSKAGLTQSTELLETNVPKGALAWIVRMNPISIKNSFPVKELSKTVVHAHEQTGNDD